MVIMLVFFSRPIKVLHTISQHGSHCCKASDEEWVAIADSMSDSSSKSSSDENISELSNNDFSGSDVESLDGSE